MKYTILDDLLVVHFDLGERKLNQWKIKFRLLLGGFSHSEGETPQKSKDAIYELNQDEVDFL